MRIISGKYGGRRFNFKIPPEIRPTTDYVRELVFNVLDNLIDIDNKVIFDLFAGSGSYGFESLSRGAEMCYFVDKSPKSIELIKKISELLSVPLKQYSIILKDVIVFLKNFEKYDNIKKPDLIFLDAPYEKKIENVVIDLIFRNQIFKKDSLVVIEHSKMLKLILPANFVIINSKETGSNIIDFIKCNL